MLALKDSEVKTRNIEHNQDNKKCKTERNHGCHSNIFKSAIPTLVPYSPDHTSNSMQSNQIKSNQSNK